MTRKQAIILLRRISNSLSKYCDVNDCICGNCAKCYDALDMAEKALEQETVSRETYDHEFNLRKEFEMKAFNLERKVAEQEETLQNLTEPNKSDLISRQDAIDAIEKESQVDGAYGYMDTKSIVDLLNDLPSAQVEKAYELGKADRPNK